MTTSTSSSASSPEFLPFALPDLTEAEIEAVVSVLRSGWITTGPRTREFEARFARATGGQCCLAVNSCTAALHLALEAFGVRPGDEVIVPVLTFAATAAVVCHLGAVPVLADVRATDHNLDPAALARALTPRTRAVIPVHFAGVPADMDEIVALARTRGAAVIADAAHAFPASYRGRNVGTLADASCFSFYATKTLTTAEGGAVVTDPGAREERMRIMSLHGISRDAWKRYSSSGSWRYEILAPGFKYNMTDVAAAMGLAQLARADGMLARRARIAARYDEAFAGEPALERLSVPADRTSARHLYVIKLTPGALRVGRDAFVEQLRRAGLGASVHFIPLHLHPYYRQRFGYRPRDFPVALAEFRRSISLPFSSAMSDAQVERVVAAVLGLVDRDRARPRPRPAAPMAEAPLGA
jgi:perosamine synthetase